MCVCCVCVRCQTNRYINMLTCSFGSYLHSSFNEEKQYRLHLTKRHIYMQNGSNVLPVFKIFLMITATWPFSMEFRSLTMMMRQEQSTSSERANRIKPTARSDRLAFTKMWRPGKIRNQYSQMKIHHSDKLSSTAESE